MSVLMMAVTIGGLILAVILLVVALWTRMIWLTKFVLGATAIWFSFYAVMLFGFSLLSEQKTLGLNEPKAFCGFYLDCHLHTEITDVRKTKMLGDRTANGEFYVVKIKVSSDARRAELGLHHPQFEVVDAHDKRYRRAEDVTASGNPFERKVQAGGAFEDEIVFDLPIDIHNPRLDIAEGIGIDKIIEAILIDDEDSVLHRRNYFKLEEHRQTVSVK
jgi:hypothetical protein